MMEKQIGQRSFRSIGICYQSRIAACQRQFHHSCGPVTDLVVHDGVRSHLDRRLAQRDRSAFCAAFTLIELLVVISIIAVLIALFLPALGGARQQGRALACSSRMRQVTMGWQLYADANDDISVPAQPGRFADETRNVYFVGNGSDDDPPPLRN